MKKILNNKKMLIIFGIMALMVIGIVIFLIVKSLNSSHYKVIKIDEAIQLTDVVNVKKNNKKIAIASKYDVGKRKIKSTGYAVKIGDELANVIFFRDNNLNGNVIQSRYLITESDEVSVLSQIGDYMETFIDSFDEIIDTDDIESKGEQLYGETKYKFLLPKEESIYVEHRLYSISYHNKDNNDDYDFNFYMGDGNYFVCEFVRLFKK